MKKKFSKPSSVDNALFQLINFQLICEFYFGSSALVTKLASSWPKHITKYRHTYMSMQNSDSDFAMKVVYAVDLRMQQLVVSCYAA